MKEDFVNFEIAKLLKEKGFTEFCFKCYGVAVLHNGANISFDEECELKDEGRGNEIEYVEGGILYNYGCNNSDKDAKVWTAPTLSVAMKWLREKHGIIITIDFDEYELTSDNKKVGYGYNIQKVETPTKYFTISTMVYDTYEEACEAAIRFCLENLI